MKRKGGYWKHRKEEGKVMNKNERRKRGNEPKGIKLAERSQTTRRWTFDMKAIVSPSPTIQYNTNIPTDNTVPAKEATCGVSERRMQLIQRNPTRMARTSQIQMWTPLTVIYILAPERTINNTANNRTTHASTTLLHSSASIYMGCIRVYAYAAHVNSSSHSKTALTWPANQTKSY